VPETDDRSPKRHPQRWLPLDPGFRRLTARTRNCLLRGGISSTAEVRAMPDEALRALPNLGRRSLREVRAVLGDARTTPPPAPHPWWLRG